ncbi:hypothetical protein [Hymenobacter defluvii]|uniref:Uncharacterized protein n=1 Tax=Hymenobacter defluvii TaxID=2054411 RepID=A0ABS3TDE2_9BACT|nr:hypothetical protein [Hymenobacter defluvii]MBO3270765.1 hypothetical protein [Hymenobacter defluvii]
MPVKQINRPFIEVPVSDRIIGGTVVKQVARYVKMTDEQLPNGEVLVVIELKVFLFSVDPHDPTQCGPALTGPGFASYPRFLHANNQTIVDGETGAIQAIRTGQTEAEWAEVVASFSETEMFQGDFFLEMRDKRSVEIGPMIRQHIRAADLLMKKFTVFE